MSACEIRDLSLISHLEFQDCWLAALLANYGLINLNPQSFLDGGAPQRDVSFCLIEIDRSTAYFYFRVA